LELDRMYGDAGFLKNKNQRAQFAFDMAVFA
jgi:hypothetical protein